MRAGKAAQHCIWRYAGEKGAKPTFRRSHSVKGYSKHLLEDLHKCLPWQKSDSGEQSASNPLNNFPQGKKWGTVPPNQLCNRTTENFTGKNPL